MLDLEIWAMEQCRVRFERQFAIADSAARPAADAYILALEAFIDAFTHGPRAGVERIGRGGGGRLGRMRCHVEWARAERQRVQGVRDQFVAPLQSGSPGPPP